MTHTHIKCDSLYTTTHVQAIVAYFIRSSVLYFNSIELATIWKLTIPIDYLLFVIVYTNYYSTEDEATHYCVETCMTQKSSLQEVAS